MATFFVTFGVIVFLVFIMAIGVLFGRKPIAGSCRGYEPLGAECAAGCKTPCMKRRMANTRTRLKARFSQDESGKTFPDRTGKTALPRFDKPEG
ncbi:MAG: (Na+)-NQR maturation NqrM [Zoogloeaceae bacterium]|jgi:hypothetical protein|nr:(Na+)-NQR maturation NqrM [Zoogloeaceae bacterium]